MTLKSRNPFEFEFCLILISDMCSKKMSMDRMRVRLIAVGSQGSLVGERQVVNRGAPESLMGVDVMTSE